VVRRVEPNLASSDSTLRSTLEARFDSTPQSTALEENLDSTPRSTALEARFD
jgi:hypothetical protein